MEKFSMGYGFRVLKFLFFWWFLSATYDSSISARFLIYRFQAVCFLPLVAILDLPGES
jgi:hypothetical protein